MTKPQSPPGKRGRPIMIPDPVRRSILLDRTTLDLAQRIGDGNISAGIRLALVQMALKYFEQPENVK